VNCPSCGLLSERGQRACARIGRGFGYGCDGPFSETVKTNPETKKEEKTDG